MDQTSDRNTSTLNPMQDGLVMRDQGRFESQHKHHSRHESSIQSTWKSASVMREFLESGEEFVWPREFIRPREEGHSTGNHSEIPSLSTIPLKWKGNLSDANAASVDKYEVPSNRVYAFKRPFAVKAFRERSTSKQGQMTISQLSAMEYIRHPHIATMLRVYLRQGSPAILMYPSATCDLTELLKCISKDFRGVLDESHQSYVLSQAITSPDGRSSPESRTSSNGSRYDSEVIADEKTPKDHQIKQYDAWPLNTSRKHNVKILRGYFVCLAQALRHLHESCGPHNNIRPENILIDESENVLLVDCTIWKKSHGHSHQTRYSRMYASPETLKGDVVVEGGASDVFSLGCVFLEMATVLLGHDIKKSSNHTITIPSLDIELEEAYSCNLRKVHSWIDLLQEVHSSLTTKSYIAYGLIPIRSMLDEDPQARPTSRDLWMQFGLMSPRICPDCDPRHPEIWRSNKDPEQSENLDSLFEEHEALENLMTKSQGYAKLRENFQALAPPAYEPSHQGRPNRELEGEYLALASSSDGSGGATENRK